MERDPSFVFNGAYTPAVCRIVSAVAAAANSPNPDAASADLKNLVPGHKVGNKMLHKLSKWESKYHSTVYSVCDGEQGQAAPSEHCQV